MSGALSWTLGLADGMSGAPKCEPVNVDLPHWISVAQGRFITLVIGGWCADHAGFCDAWQERIDWVWVP